MPGTITKTGVFVKAIGRRSLAHQLGNAGGEPADNGTGRSGGLVGPEQGRDAPLGGIPRLAGTSRY